MRNNWDFQHVRSFSDVLQTPIGSPLQIWSLVHASDLLRVREEPYGMKKEQLLKLANTRIPAKQSH